MSLIEDTPLLDIKRRISRLQHKKYVKPVLDAAEGTEGTVTAPDEYKMPEANPDAEGLGREIVDNLKKITQHVGLIPSHYRVAGTSVLAALHPAASPVATAPPKPPITRSASKGNTSPTSASSSQPPPPPPKPKRGTTAAAVAAAAPAGPNTFYFANDMSVSSVAALLSKTAEALTNIIEAIKKLEKANSADSIKPQTRQDIFEQYEIVKPVMDVYVQMSYRNGFAQGYTMFAFIAQKVNMLVHSLGQVSDKIVPVFASLAPRLEALFRNYHAI